jgi:predicted RNase H-like nuclease (RuvC/YqgF family)
MEKQFILKNGNVVYGILDANLVRDSEGKPSYFLGSVIDITDRKKAEEELKKHQDHLEELVNERTTELEEKNKELNRFNKLFVGREFRIKELKDKVKKLEKELARKK